jgi:hypothetical protein
MAHTASQSWMEQCRDYATLHFGLFLILLAPGLPFQSRVSWTEETSPPSLKRKHHPATALRTTVMTLDRGRSRFRPPGRCKVDDLAAFVQIEPVPLIARSELSGTPFAL